MFPGGLDPEFIRSMQERAAVFQDIAQRNWPVYESAMQRLVQSGALKRQEGHYAALQQALKNMPPSPAFSLPQGVANSLQSAMGILNSPGFLDRLEAARQASEVAEQRYGPDGLAAAQQIAAQRLAAGPGLERGAERILNGRADEILEEAAAIASSPEARQTIERADKDALLELAQQEAKQDSRAFGGEVRTGLDVETVVASVGNLSEEDLQALEYFALQLVRVLIFVVAAAVVSTGALDVETAAGALSGVYSILECIKAARAKKNEKG